MFTTPNGYLHYHTDLMGGALQSLSETYHAVISEDSGECHVNMLFSAESENISALSGVPESGRMNVQTRKQCKVFIRFPAWVDKKSIELRVNGNAQSPVWKNEELSVGLQNAGAEITATFDQPRLHTVEEAPGYDNPFEIDWVGDTIIGMKPEPAGRIALY